VVLNPIIMFGVQSLIFQYVLKVQLNNYFVFLLSGLLPWIFIVQSMEMCTSLFVTNAQLLKSFHMNPLILVIAQLIDNLINFLAAFALIFVALLLGLGMGPSVSLHGLIFTPLAVFVLLAGVIGLCLLLATTQVFFRDTRFIVGFGTSVLFYLTPIFYPKDLVPPHLRWVSEVNPFYRLVEPFRITIYEFNRARFEISLLKGTLTAALLLGAATWLWQRKKSELYVNF
jgi:ABC-type polysaccharide/polyol phosphate export permease